MPYFFPACIDDSIWCTLLSRMSARMAGVQIMISAAMTRPRPFAFCNRVCVMTPSSTNASCARICDCWCDGKTSMMRLMLSIAELVCSVAKARWPVSAIVRAAPIVSRSRISPISTTSGSCRKAYLSAAAKLFVSVPISRWLTMQLWWR